MMRSYGMTFISTTMCLLLLLVVVMVISSDAAKSQSDRDEVESSLSSYLSPQQLGERRLLQVFADKKRKCAWQAESCDVYTAPCCPGLKCSNFSGGYCLSKLQKCLCLPDNREIY